MATQMQPVPARSLAVALDHVRNGEADWPCELTPEQARHHSLVLVGTHP